MNEIKQQITHPIALNTTITASKPSCPCRGATFSLVTGAVQKVIHNQTGYWYYLSTGVTIRDQWVTEVK